MILARKERQSYLVEIDAMYILPYRHIYLTPTTANPVCPLSLSSRAKSHIVCYLSLCYSQVAVKEVGMGNVSKERQIEKKNKQGFTLRKDHLSEWKKRERH